MNMEQKMHLIQRESVSRGSVAKPPGTSGGRIPTQFRIEDLPPKRYLPVSVKHKINNLET